MIEMWAAAWHWFWQAVWDVFSSDYEDNKHDKE